MYQFGVHSLLLRTVTVLRERESVCVCVHMTNLECVRQTDVWIIVTNNVRVQGVS